MKKSERNSEAAMPMQDLTVKTAGQNSTAQEDVQQMLIMHRVVLQVFIGRDASFSKSVLSALS